MKKISLFIIALFFIPSLLQAATLYKVERVVDGDTIIINYKGKRERIRFLRVDTPESVHENESRNSEMGRKASKYTKKRLTGKLVGLEFESEKRGDHGRLLAYIILDGKNYNLELVREGWSRYFTKYGPSERHHAEFVEAQKEAKRLKKGIWKNWYHNAKSAKKVYKEKKVILGKSQNFHGNIKSHKFHAPGCEQYNCKNCNRKFKTQQEAIKAGYSPCGACIHQ